MKRHTVSAIATIAMTCMSASLAACGRSHQAWVGPADEGPGNSPSSAVTNGAATPTQGGASQPQVARGMPTPQCSGGLRVVGDPTWEGYTGDLPSYPAAGNMPTSNPGVDILQIWASNGPVVCANISDKQLTDAAAALPSQFSQLCTDMPPKSIPNQEGYESGRDGWSVWDHTPPDVLDRAAKAFDAATGGGPVGTYSSQDTFSGFSVQPNDPKLELDPNERQDQAKEAVEAGALVMCP